MKYPNKDLNNVYLIKLFYEKFNFISELSFDQIDGVMYQVS